jgi:DNA repair exonuclease SbcCD ATPase subunit
MVRLSKNEEKAKELRMRVREQADRITYIGKQLREPQEAIRVIDDFIADYTKKLEKEKQIYDILSSKISKADDAVNKEYNEKSKRRSEIHEELGRVRQVIGELSSIDIYGMMLEPELARKVCEEMTNILRDRINYLQARAEEEREEAAKRFSKNISALMESLGFVEFRTIKLSGAPSYRLYIERFDPEKKEYKSQDVGTLSTSEKLAIALILQIALKETYMKNLPFFVLDDILEGFDPERCEQVIKYLKEKVKQEDWFIIATRLVEELDVPRVRYL